MEEGGERKWKGGSSMIIFQLKCVNTYIHTYTQVYAETLHESRKRDISSL